MDSSQLVTLATAILGSGVLVALINYFTTRRKNRVDAEVAERTAPSQVAIVGVQELEAKLSYLTRVIEVLERTNLRLETDLEDQVTFNAKLTDRVKLLTNRCDQLELAIRRLCLENNLDITKFLTP